MTQRRPQSNGRNTGRKRPRWVPPVPFNPNDDGQLVPAPLAYAIPFATIGILAYQPVCTVAANIDGLLGVLTGLLGATTLVALIAISSYYLPPALVATASFCSLWLSLPAAYWLLDQYIRWEERVTHAGMVDAPLRLDHIPKVYFSVLAIVLTAGLMLGFVVTMRRES